LPAVARALNAERVVRSTRGERTVSAEAFFVGYLTTAIQPDELLVETRWPALPNGTGWAYLEVSRRHGDFAMVGVASTIRLQANGTIGEARLAYTGASATPVRAHEAERELRGQPASDATFRAAAELAARALDPQSDVHASAAYRRHVARVLTQRALTAAITRAPAGAA
jgi:carbon-monoxide dehydrogenase medium subunit